MSETNTTYSSSSPLKIDGKLKEFPYNPHEASAQSELIQIMGASHQLHSQQKNHTVLPFFPYGNHTVQPFINAAASLSSSTTFQPPLIIITPVSATLSNGTSANTNVSGLASDMPLLPLIPRMAYATLAPEMQMQLSFLQVTDTQLLCYISPPTSNMLNMEDVWMRVYYRRFTFNRGNNIMNAFNFILAHGTVVHGSCCEWQRADG